jgi:ribose transport system substrate-binding protein
MGDNRKAGQEAAKALIKYLKNNGNVAVLEGTSGVATAEERKKGFEEIMASEGTGMKIVASQPANYNRNMGYQITQTILVAHPEIKGIFGANDELALGAMKAVEEAGRNDIAIVGINYGKEAQQAMVAGKMLGSISQSPYDMGRIAVEKTYDYITKSIKPEYMILTPTTMMYKEDVKP